MGNVGLDIILDALEIVGHISTPTTHDIENQVNPIRSHISPVETNQQLASRF